jgi:hypothetical protein
VSLDGKNFFATCGKMNSLMFDFKFMPESKLTEPKLTSGASWQPNADQISHAGSPVTVDADFFIAPPPQIGELISVGTTLPTSAHPLPVNTRWAVIVGSGVLLAIVFHVLFKIAGLTLLVGGFVGATAWYLTRFNHTCSFVGMKGMASSLSEIRFFG